ncbi:MAG TPA: glycosyltransferase family 4 protein [Polyangiaceae bacterium]
MRIAIVSTPSVRVPPKGYGGTELFCGHLAEALLARGHEVTLFATGDSEFSGELRACYPKPTWPPSDTVELTHMRWCLNDIACDRFGFDAVQINCAVGLRIARDLGIPVVYTLHHHREEKLSRMYAAHPEVHFVAISRRQLELEVPLRRATVIHHGVDVGEYPASPRSKGYVLHLGRFAPEKGTHHAIDAALRAKVPLVLAGRVHEKVDDHSYFDDELKPRLERAAARVRVAGEADHPRKLALLQGASALLCPIEWEEPFGLIAIEAMLTGTPVIGFARGSFPEIIDPGVTGLLVSNVEEMARAIHAVQGYSRRRCAARARERFSAGRMAAEYEQAFFSTIRRQSSSGLVLAHDFPRPSRLIG